MRKVLPIIGSLLLLTIVVQPVLAAPAESDVLGYHVVMPGETLFCIARAYQVDPWAIAVENGIVNPNHIQPYMVLAIPAVYANLPGGPTCTPQFGPPPPYPCVCEAYHTVVTGENLFRISLHYGVSMWRIAECNHIFDLNYIRAGDVLCIPDP